MEVVARIPSGKILEKGDKHYRYHFFTLVKSVLLFPFVIYYSRKYAVLFIKFCFEYQRDGIYLIQSQNNCEFNSLALYEHDIYEKKLAQFGYLFDQSEINIEEIVVKNSIGNNISCLIMKNNKTNKWVIGLHGWTENKYLGIRLVWWFYQQGYNVLTFDSMAHGKSYGEYTDIGYTSAHDLVDIIKWMKATNVVQSIGIIGNSMGASCGLYFCQNFYEPLLKWVIADSPFANLIMQYRYVMENRYQIPWWMVAFRLRHRFQKYNKINLNRYHLLKPKTNFADILLIHGKVDTFVPFFMSKMIVKAYLKKGLKLTTLFLDDINHIETLYRKHDEYIVTIAQFIRSKEIGGE